MSNDPSLPPDDSESVEAERVGDVVVIRIGFPLGIPHERARCETAVAFPVGMTYRIIATILGVAGK